LEQVVAKVKEDVIRAKQEQHAQSDAQGFLDKVKKGKSFAEASKSLEIASKETGFFSRRGAIPQIGYEPQIQKDAFELTMKKPLMENAVKGRQGWFVMQLKERQAPDDAGFKKEQTSIVKRMTQQKKQAAFGVWLEDLKSRSKIEINRDLTKI
jgi:hypothetical protein